MTTVTINVMQGPHEVSTTYPIPEEAVNETVWDALQVGIAAYQAVNGDDGRDNLTIEVYFREVG